MSLGTLFANEVPYPISRIHLRGGAIVIEATIEGPVELPRDTEVRIHDPQGNLVAVAPWILSKSEARIAARVASGETVTIAFPLEVEAKAAVNWPSSTSDIQAELDRIDPPD